MFVPHRLRIARLANGLTQQQLAQKCGMHDSAIRRYESGRQNPKIITINKIAKALGTDWIYFDDSYYGPDEFYDIICKTTKQTRGQINAIHLLSIVQEEQEEKENISKVQPRKKNVNSNSQENSVLTPEYNLLNREGKEETNRYIKYLSTQEKYTAPDSSTASEHEEGEP